MASTQKKHKRVFSTLDGKIAPVVSVYNNYRMKNGYDPIVKEAQNAADLLAILTTSCRHQQCGRDLAHKESGLCLLHYDEHLRSTKNGGSVDYVAGPAGTETAEDKIRGMMSCLSPSCTGNVFRLAYCKRHYAEIIQRKTYIESDESSDSSEDD